MNNVLNNSSIFSDVNKKKDESNNEKKILDENLKNFNIYNKKENKYINKNIDDDITSFSISSTSEEFPNLYKIPKNKLFNKISPNETYLETYTKNEKSKKCQNKVINKNNIEILNAFLSTPKKTVKDKVIMVSELDRDFAKDENDNDNTLDEKEFQHYNKDMIKKRQNDLKKKIRNNFRLLIKENEEEKNKNDISNNNSKDMKVIKKSKDKNQSKVKIRYAKYTKNVNQPLIDISRILNKLKKNQNFEKRNINNNNSISLKKISERTKIDVNGTLVKKISINTKKISNSKMNKSKNIKKQQENKDKSFYFLNKKFKNLILKKNEFNNYLNTFNYTINSNNMNCSSDKIRREYSSIRKRQSNIFKQDKKEKSSSMLIKKKKIIINRIGLNNKKQTFNYSFNFKKENSKILGKNKNVIKMPIKVNITSNDIKRKKFININLSSNIGKSKPKFFRNINKSSLLLKTKKIFVHKKL